MREHEIDSERVLADYDRYFLSCRVDRHRWGRATTYELIDPTHAERRKLCEDCMALRWEEIDLDTFERTGRLGYRYPRGYLTPRTGLTLADFRERLLREDFAEAMATKGRVVGSNGLAG